LQGGALRIVGAENSRARLSTRRTCGAECVEESSCRMFLCARCRCQVLVCQLCDRGQIYCLGTCAREARRDRQREARRRYQATPRGRALHTERNRRYRTRQLQRVTDHGLAKEPEARPSLALVVNAVSSEPLSRKSPKHAHCHHCGCLASVFVRQSALRLGYRRTASRINRRDARPGRPP
jgi:hypothetical protein